jgi:hypothetical protein
MPNGIEKMSVKDVCLSLNVSISTGTKILNDIKKEFDLIIVTYYHFKKYLKIE